MSFVLLAHPSHLDRAILSLAPILGRLTALKATSEPPILVANVDRQADRQYPNPLKLIYP